MEEEYEEYQDGCPECGGEEDNNLYNGEDYQECDCGWCAQINKKEKESK